MEEHQMPDAATEMMNRLSDAQQDSGLMYGFIRTLWVNGELDDVRYQSLVSQLSPRLKSVMEPMDAIFKRPS